ncbi:hypothetical protein [Runella sp.]|uniref:hypothetical protein n=1 Tax=Runella sp. TaxID=1960881 RepID=UPI00301B53BE
MKPLLIALISLISFVSQAQFVPFNLPGEIVKVGRTMVDRHAAAQADTCLKKSEVKAAKLYTDFLEERLQKSQAETALLRFQVEQRGQRNEVLHTENDALKIAAVDFGKFQKTTGWVCAALGAVGAVLVGMAIGH